MLRRCVSTRETLGKVAIEFSTRNESDGQNVPDTMDGMMEVSQASHHAIDWRPHKVR